MTDDQKVSMGRNRLNATLMAFAIRLGALALLLYWSVILIRPFMTIFIWSAVLTVALYPLFDWTARRLGGRRRLAAALITIVGLIVIIGPATWLAMDLVESLRSVSGRLDFSMLTLPPAPKSLKEWPIIGDKIFELWHLASTNFKAALAAIAPGLKPIGTRLLNIAGNTGIGILQFFISWIIAGFLFDPAPLIVARIRAFLRHLTPKRAEEFLVLAAATVRTVAQGVIGVSALQAVLAGIGLLAAGVPAAGLITIGVLIFGIIQIGPALIIIPVIVWGWMTMETSTALWFTAYMVPVNLLDNILKPILVGRGLRTPMLVTLIGVIGGTLAYGITGLFLGPIVLAMFWELISAWTMDDID